MNYFEMNEEMLLALNLSLDNIFCLNFDSEMDHCAWIMSKLAITIVKKCCDWSTKSLSSTIFSTPFVVPQFPGP